jgi:long-chain acyl-CoA synthetase
MSAGENIGRKTVDALQALGSQIATPSGQMLSAAEMVAASYSVAASLQARACAADEPVVLFIANEPLDLAGFLGVWLAGGVAVPIHVATPATPARALVTRLGSRFAIRAGSLSSVGAAHPPSRSLLTGAALIIFTSGSTGLPKGVVLGHKGLS